MSACSDLVGNGVIRGVLGAVDCQTRAFAEAGYSSLSGSSNFQTALTALLTIYVALVGYRMLFAQGGSRLSDAPGIALKIGAMRTRPACTRPSPRGSSLPARVRSMAVPQL